MFKIKEKIKQWLDRIINGSRRNLDLSHKKLKKFPVPPESIRGDFSCSRDLKSLERVLKSYLRQRPFILNLFNR